MSDIVPAGQSPFEQIRHEDEQGNEYWMAREFSRLLEYTDWRNFEKAIKRAKKACLNSAQPPRNHFVEVNEMVPIGSGAERELPSYRLTRYACYLIAQNADPEKEIVAKAQSYFATKTRERELDEAHFEEARQDIISRVGKDDPLIEVIDRIRTRQELTDAHKALFAQARKSGVITKKQFATFMDWGYRGQYHGERENDIHARKELAEGEEISDFMYPTETSLNVLRSQIATSDMRRKGDTTAGQANKTHYEAGKAVRKFAVEHGIIPEELPTPRESYRDLVKREAARIAEEERQAALESENQRGLWGQLPPEEKGSL